MATVPEAFVELLDACAQAAVIVDSERRILYCNEAYARANQQAAEELVGTEAREHLCRSIALEDGMGVEIWPDSAEDFDLRRGLVVHREKIQSLGRLVAGIAHELNNPINFIYGNVDFLSQYLEDLLGLVQKLDESESVSGEARELLSRLKDAIEWDYLLGDSRKLINSIRNGAERTATIVRDLKNFSRVGSPEMTEADVVSSIEVTLNLLAPLYRGRVEIVREFQPNLPKLVCNAAHLAQVFMNLLANAAQAIEGPGTIRISVATIADDTRLRVAIADDGQGISDEILHRITDPFFTTKDVGEGTGLGLWISESIVRAHGGTLSFQSAPGEGSTFVIELPIGGRSQLINRDSE